MSRNVLVPIFTVAFSPLESLLSNAALLDFDTTSKNAIRSSRAIVYHLHINSTLDARTTSWKPHTRVNHSRERKFYIPCQTVEDKDGSWWTASATCSNPNLPVDEAWYLCSTFLDQFSALSKPCHPRRFGVDFLHHYLHGLLRVGSLVDINYIILP